MVTSSRKLRAFKKWMKTQGIDCSNALDLVITTNSASVSVIALCDLNEGDLVASIPKESCLTVKTSGAREMIEQAELEGILGLAVAVMYERSLGPLSPWFGYLQLLPYSEPIPLLWSVSEIDSLLVGTELHKIVKDDKALIYEDWKECIEPLFTSASLQLKAEHFGVKDYLAAKSLVASRSFQVDDYYGCGMVPLADLFNHKTGAEDVHFTSSYSESDDDADNEKYGNDNSGPTKRSSHSGGEGFSGSDLESSHSELDDDAHNDKHENDNNETTIAYSRGESISGSYSESSSVSGDDLTVVEMIMVKKVKAGAEVFNTYGSLGNAALLHRYGFGEPDNQYDIVNLDLELVLQWSSSRFSHRYSRRRLSLWRELDCSGCVSQNSEYFEISFDGEPQIELLVLLYIILLPEEVYAELDLAVSITDGFEKSKGFKLSKKDIILFGKGFESNNSMLLTDGVCAALLALADIRGSLYGSNCVEDDIKTLNCCCLVKEPKIYYSLVLRISERMILEKLRCYATASAKMRTKGGKTRRRAKIQ
ncbi:ribosomal lysine N-methyltransferase 3 isoform X1 [Lycium barbarum]|uniref:ribosomal lysine N-methyltransferase 3 isoform X1 n=1 Tax=Lycium barbarum TaxID=112863 RepID=UPI00293E585A|nr:ribosomal lysine N-methyltransferase 3 isoform X1 [Lycium barbarum]